MKTMLPAHLMKTIALLLLWRAFLDVSGYSPENNNHTLSIFGHSRSPSVWLKKQFRSHGRVLKKNTRHFNDGKAKKELARCCEMAATSNHHATDISTLLETEASIRKNDLPKGNIKVKRWWRNSIKQANRIRGRRAKCWKRQRKPFIGGRTPDEQEETLYNSSRTSTGNHYDPRVYDIEETPPTRDVFKTIFFPNQITDVSGWPHKRNRILVFKNVSLYIPASERNSSQLEIDSAKLILAVRTRSTKSNDTSSNKVRIKVHIRHLKDRILLSYEKMILTDRPQVVHLNLLAPLVKEMMNPSPGHEQTIVLKVTCRWQGNRKCEFIGQADKYQSKSDETIHKHDGSLTKKLGTLRKPCLEFTFF